MPLACVVEPVALLAGHWAVAGMCCSQFLPLSASAQPQQKPTAYCMLLTVSMPFPPSAGPLGRVFLARRLDI